MDLPNGFISERNVDDVVDWLDAVPAAVLLDDSCGDVGRFLCWC